MNPSELIEQVPQKGLRRRAREVGSYPVAKIARDLYVSVETLHKWVNRAEIDVGESEGLTTGEKEALRRFRKEVKGLEEEPRYFH